MRVRSGRRWLSSRYLKAWATRVLLGARGGRHTLLQERERSILIGWLLGVCSVIPDIIATWLTGSAAMLTDVFRTSTDTLASFLSWLTVRRSSHAKTRDYNYGYGKLENLASLAVAGTMTISFLVITIFAVDRLRHPHHLDVHHLAYGIVFTFGAGLLNSVCWARNRRLARRSSSPVMESQWRLYRGKTSINASVFTALLLSGLLHHFDWSKYIDPITSLSLAAFLLFNSYQLVSMSLYDLLDRSLGESLQQQIIHLLSTCAHGYQSLLEIRSRRSGSHVYLEIFLAFDGEQRLADVQLVSDEIRACLSKKIPGSNITIVPCATPLPIPLLHGCCQSRTPEKPEMVASVSPPLEQ